MTIARHDVTDSSSSSHLSFIHHTLGCLLVGASDYISDLHPAAVADTPLVRFHLLPVFDQPRLAITVTCIQSKFHIF